MSQGMMFSGMPFRPALRGLLALALCVPLALTLPGCSSDKELSSLK